MNVPAFETLDMMYQMNMKNNDKYHVVYCLDNMHRQKGVKTKLLSVPTGEETLLSNGYKIVFFVDLHAEDIQNIPPRLCYQSFQEMIQEKSTCPPYKRLVPPPNVKTRFKLLNEIEFESMKSTSLMYLKIENYQFLLGEEIGSLNRPENMGTLLLTYGIDTAIPSITESINMNTIHKFHRVYGKGSDRKTCFHIGFATYRGTKNTNRPFPRVFVQEDHVPEHQYFNEVQNACPLAQAISEQCINTLGENAMSWGRHEHLELFDVIDNSCKKSILTFGSPYQYLKQFPLTQNKKSFLKQYKNINNNYLSFSSSDHIDLCDNLFKHDETSVVFSNDCNTPYTKRLYKMVGPAMSTTCQYAHI